VDAGPRVQEGVVGRAELLPGVYIVESLVKVENGCVITSIINTTAGEVLQQGRYYSRGGTTAGEVLQQGR